MLSILVFMLISCYILYADACAPRAKSRRPRDVPRGPLARGRRDAKLRQRPHPCRLRSDCTPRGFELVSPRFSIVIAGGNPTACRYHPNSAHLEFGIAEIPRRATIAQPVNHFHAIVHAPITNLYRAPLLQPSIVQCFNQHKQRTPIRLSAASFPAVMEMLRFSTRLCQSSCRGHVNNPHTHTARRREDHTHSMALHGTMWHDVASRCIRFHSDIQASRL